MDEGDQKTKDELDVEVDKKYQKELAESQELEAKALEEEDPDYDEDGFASDKGGEAQPVPKEESIKSEQMGMDSDEEPF